MNIAEAQQEIKELTQQRNDILKAKVAPIMEQIESLNQFIKGECQHYVDLLLVKQTYETDEYDKRCPSWDKYEIECSVCGKNIVANKQKVDESDVTLQELMVMSEGDMAKLQ